MIIHLLNNDRLVLFLLGPLGCPCQEIVLLFVIFESGRVSLSSRHGYSWVRFFVIFFVRSGGGSLMIWSSRMRVMRRQVDFLLLAKDWYLIESGLLFLLGSHDIEPDLRVGFFHFLSAWMYFFVIIVPINDFLVTVQLAGNTDSLFALLRRTMVTVILILRFVFVIGVDLFHLWQWQVLCCWMFLF